MPNSLITVIMAGGNGSRLWPLSRSHFPKQFLPLTGDKTMFQLTLERATAFGSDRIIVICNEDHRFIVAEQLRQLGMEADIILEPFGRNTAPAICLAAIHARRSDPQAKLMVLAADHDIKDIDSFAKAVGSAEVLAEKGFMVTFGIVPSHPETGYGYVQRGSEVENEKGFWINRFVEKPNRATALEYLNSKEYYWNSGMFMFKAERYLEELETCSPNILDACQKASHELTPDLDFLRINADEFASCPDDSIDYAVMEKTTRGAVIPLDAGWNDVGAWSSLWDVNDKDGDGNVVKGDVMLHEARNCLVHASHKLVCAVGLEDVVVVETKDAVMVAAKNSSQDIKHIVSRLKLEGRQEHQLHREVYRPWGKYDSVDEGQRYQVKRITVNPGEKLSIQMHHHRAEHWIVVSGTARVTCGDVVKLLSENQSVYIPIGVVHCLENPGKIPLELIEVQSGSYLGEDDIVRFEDLYGRS